MRHRNLAADLHFELDVTGPIVGTEFPETAVDATGSVEFVGIQVVTDFCLEIARRLLQWGNPVVHFEIIGEDQQLLNGFYGSVFDWKIEQVMDGYATVNTGSGIVGGIGAMVEARRHVIFYVEVADIHAVLALIESKGGKLGFGPHPLPTRGHRRRVH